MEYFCGNSHVVSVEDYKVVEYLDDIGWDIYIRMEYLTGFLDYCMGKELQKRKLSGWGSICAKLWNIARNRISSTEILNRKIYLYQDSGIQGDFGIARELDRNVNGLSKKGTFSLYGARNVSG